METVSQNGRQQHYGALLILRDILIFLALLTCFALLYRIAPSVFFGTSSAATMVRANEPVLPESKPDAPATIQPVVEVAVSEPVGVDAALSTAALADTTSAGTPVAPAATAEAPAQSAPTGDFSAVFPAADTGAGALHSYQSDEKRIAITKVSENGVTYFIADVWVKNISAFKTAFAKGEYGRNIHEMPAKIAADNGATFAVSGDYYGARDKGAVVRNGSLYRDVMNEDVCILRYDGTLDAYRASEFSSLQSLDETVWQAWAFGPTLVKDGAACDTSSSKIKVKNPRCAIGFYEPGHYCFLVVDGRQDGYSSGMSLSELSDTFVALGCKTAYNLDGGATAIMVFDGQVVNRPIHGGRASSDVICF